MDKQVICAAGTCLAGKGKRIGKTLGLFAKWLAISGVIGLLLGGVGTLFQYSLRWAAQAQETQPWLLFLLPLAGVAIAGSYRLCGIREDRGTNLILMAIQNREQLTWKTAPLVFAGTVLTHLCGGSSGREGAALQIGGSLANQCGKWLRLDEKDRHMITMCGMSACFSALFGTPIAAVVFSMEVISVGIMHYAAIVPCLTASLIGFGVAGWFGVEPTRFVIGTIPESSVLNFGRVLLLAALCAVVSVLFCLMIHAAGRLYRRIWTSPMIRAAAGGVVVVLLTLLVGTRYYNGTGAAAIGSAFSGTCRPEAFALKMLFTACTLGAGFKGGEIVPTFFIGATFGNVMGGCLGLPPAFGAGIGMIALFCGVTNSPITALLLSIEMFGAQGLLFFAVAAAVSYMLSGYTGLYSAQKILYSKFRPEFIDREAD